MIFLTDPNWKQKAKKLNENDDDKKLVGTIDKGRMNEYSIVRTGATYYYTWLACPSLELLL